MTHHRRRPVSAASTDTGSRNSGVTSMLMTQEAAIIRQKMRKMLRWNGKKASVSSWCLEKQLRIRPLNVDSNTLIGHLRI